MNDELIFLKTTSGEDAVRDRTRLVQRNLRMVLILVDGLTNVGTLKQKAGDPVMIEGALAELQRIGMIESTADRAARQVSSVAEALAIIEKEQPVVEDETPIPVDYPIADTVFEALTPTEQAMSGRATAEIEPIVDVQSEDHVDVGSGAKRKEPVADGWVSNVKSRWTQMREERAFEQAYGKPEKAADVISIESRLPRRRRFSVGKLLLGSIMALLLAAAAFIALYPEREYRAPLQAAIGRILGSEDVTIGDVSIVYAPRPSVVLTQVLAGRDADIRIDTLALTLSPRLLVGGAYFSAVEARGLSVRASVLGRLKDFFPKGKSDAWRPEWIKIQGLSLNLGWTQAGNLAGTLYLSPDGGLSGFSGNTPDDHIRIEAQPVADGLAFQAQGTDWDAPLGPALHLTSLGITGVLRASDLTVNKCDARAFEGIITCSGNVEWRATPSAKVDFSLKRVKAAEALTAIGVPALLDGEVDGRFQWQASPPATAWLAKNSRLEGTMTVTRGRLKRIDLSSALRNRGLANGSRGGDTSFEELNGKLSIDPDAIRFSGVKLNSGLLTATGQVAINRSSAALSGTADVNLQGAAGMRGQVSFAGTSQAPTIKAGL